ncbi:hypothetical protein FQA47_003065 [Oryzias melastigma]|uniref:Uncharacterized protein n=1 Tax=Oryzias melastigma TaxID=30732 RepID=A0A834FDW7_ORYME|nr:hypothetical protein FQA47_003065 [Oryzias melastigma]
MNIEITSGCTESRGPPPSLRPTVIVPSRWLKMSVNSDNSCVLLSAKDARTSCIFPPADEKDDIPKVGDDSVLEMLSYSKFSDLETWLCMPSDLLLPRTLDSNLTSSPTLSSSHISIHSSYLSAMSSPSPASSLRLSTCSEPGDTEKLFSLLSSSVGKEEMFLSTPYLPILSSTPAAVSEQSSKSSAANSSSQSSVNVKKRRRLAASPGGLHWNSAGSLQRDFSSADPLPSEAGVGAKGPGCKIRAVPIRGVGGATPEWAGEKGVLTKSVSCDGAQLKLLSRLDRGCRKLRGIQSLGTTGRYDCKKRTNSKISRLAQRWNRTPTRDDLIRHLKPPDHTGTPRSSLSLDR